MRQLIAGNWKMHGLSPALGEIKAVRRGLEANHPHADVLVCPPFTLISRALAAAEDVFAIGGQDCADKPSGAYTGDVSAEMLHDAGAVAVIVGHSERRRYHGETSALVARKAHAAWRAGLRAIVCIGETEAERDAGHAFDVCNAQLRESVPEGADAQNLSLAYEPIWAIGSGKTAKSSDILEMHNHLREQLHAHLGKGGETVRILYGGSVKPDNAAEVLALKNVGGALAGGASLKAASFLQIVAAAATP